MNTLKKIVIIGPESTGKSTLCMQLAEHYNTSWCPEFAREYLLKHGMNYNFDDLLSIAKGQVALEDEYVQLAKSNRQMANKSLEFKTNSPGFIFIDTDMYVMKVWCEFVFGKCHRFILDQIVERKYDLYLLLNIDLPWIHDELREYPDIANRKILFEMYKDILINQSTPWVLIYGEQENRLQQAITAVDSLFNS